MINTWSWIWLIPHFPSSLLFILLSLFCWVSQPAKRRNCAERHTSSEIHTRVNISIKILWGAPSKSIRASCCKINGQPSTLLSWFVHRSRSFCCIPSLQTHNFKNELVLSDSPWQTNFTFFTKISSSYITQTLLAIQPTSKFASNNNRQPLPLLSKFCFLCRLIAPFWQVLELFKFWEKETFFILSFLRSLAASWQILRLFRVI
jgi:hypothetical protein